MSSQCQKIMTELRLSHVCRLTTQMEHVVGLHYLSCLSRYVLGRPSVINDST